MAVLSNELLFCISFQKTVLVVADIADRVTWFSVRIRICIMCILSSFLAAAEHRQAVYDTVLKYLFDEWRVGVMSWVTAAQTPVERLMFCHQHKAALS